MNNERERPVWEHSFGDLLAHRRIQSINLQATLLTGVLKAKQIFLG